MQKIREHKKRGSAFYVPEVLRNVMVPYGCLSRKLHSLCTFPQWITARPMEMAVVLVYGKRNITSNVS